MVLVILKTIMYFPYEFSKKKHYLLYLLEIMIHDEDNFTEKRT